MTSTEKSASGILRPSVPSPHRLRILVAVCTYRRNEPLATLLTSLIACAEAVSGEASVGVVVVDDNPDGDAKEVAEDFDSRFENGVTYRRSGKGNISIARNLALSTAAPVADWIALTDDDCEAPKEWLKEYLKIQQQFDCDVVTGPLVLRAPTDAPRWVTDQPFFADAQFTDNDGAEKLEAATNNSFYRASLWEREPRVRFREDLGVLGGEDMVFYRTLQRSGAHIRFALNAKVYGNEPSDRCTFRSQVKSRFWLGNSEYITNRVLQDATATRLVLRGGRRLGAALLRPISRGLTGLPPQWRYSVACVARSLGLLCGPLGVRWRHH